MRLEGREAVMLLTLVLFVNAATSVENVRKAAKGAASWKSSCERPDITNGRLVETSRKSATGHMFKYRCCKGCRRLGNMFNICLRGRWVLKHAVCARRGCAALPSPEGGSARRSVLGDVTTFQCHPGRQLVGNPALFCDGKHWNGTAPRCQGSGRRLWVGGAGAGWGSGRLSSSRLPAEASVSGCFRFWHRQRRRRPSSGSTPIRAYALVSDPSAPRGQRRIVLQGTDRERRGQWTERTGPLPTIDRPFQVVIEAARPAGRETTVSLRDVTLMHGDECDAVSPTLPPLPPPVEGREEGVFSTGREEGEGIQVSQTPVEATDHDKSNPQQSHPSSHNPTLHSYLHHVPPPLDRTPTTPSNSLPPSTSSHQGTGSLSHRPGDAEVATETPSVTSRPSPISTSPGQGDSPEPIAGSSAPLGGTRPILGPGGDEIRPIPPGGDGEARPMMGGEQQVTSVVVEERGQVGSGGEGDGQGDNRDGGGLDNFGGVGENAGNGISKGVGNESHSGDNGGGGRRGDSGAGDHIGEENYEDVLTSRRDVNVAEDDSQLDQSIAREVNIGVDGGGDRIILPLKKMKPSFSHVHLTTISEDTVEDSARDVSDVRTISTQARDVTANESPTKELPLFLIPPQPDSINITSENHLPTSSTPRNLSTKIDMTDNIIFSDTKTPAAPAKQDQDKTATKEISGAILFQNPAIDPNPSSEPAAGDGLPFHVILTASACGCLLLLSALSIALIRRRGRPKPPPAAAAGAVFEPEPGDRGPIAQLIRQNRLDHQREVPAPVSL